MGSLAGSIFDLFSGNPTAREQGQFGDLADYGINTGEGAENAANKYYGDILSGNPELIAETLAPEISAGNQQVEQQAKTNAEFGNRGGGTNASTNAARSQERGNIINLIGQLQQGAAGSEAGIGSGMLGLGSNSLSNEANLATANQNRMANDINGVVNGAAQIASPFLGGGAGGVDPYESLYNASHADTSSLSPTNLDLTDMIQ